MRHLETLCGSHGGLKDSTSAKSEQTVATLLECPSRLECPYLFIFFFPIYLSWAVTFILLRFRKVVPTTSQKVIREEF